jgi:hypothetical protein
LEPHERGDKNGYSNKTHELHKLHEAFDGGHVGIFQVESLGFHIFKTAFDIRAPAVSFLNFFGIVNVRGDDEELPFDFFTHNHDV